MARKHKQKPWEALGISQRTYYRRKQAGTLEAKADVAKLLEKAVAAQRAKHDQQPPQPLDFDRAGFLQDQLKEPNSAAAEAVAKLRGATKVLEINEAEFLKGAHQTVVEAGLMRNQNDGGRVGWSVIQNQSSVALDTLSHSGGNAPYQGETITFVDDPKPVDGRVKVPLTEEQTLEFTDCSKSGGTAVLKDDDKRETVSVGVAERLLSDAADTALVEEFLWVVERILEDTHKGALPRNMQVSGRMADALYRALKDGKGEPA